jgi:hypothetical protein
MNLEFLLPRPKEFSRGACSEQGLAAPVATLFLQPQPLGLGFLKGQPEPALEQGHLGRQMAALTHFNFGVT